ncbi:unnamed protein product [Clonostachys rosea]|uniref:Pyruvate decarboxylase n=1 Tax=Bionectria ochroleuca TaxID=29856 RepID=A0ABY6UGS3_BIOOC|nr:unnamed protein product [Clonostachys rosea]
MGSEVTSGAAAILYALEAAGITHLFVNLGSDHPAFLAAFASNKHNIQIFTSPNEMNALSAASGFAQITGKPAGVLVHVECGTQGLAGAIHNVSKGRIPVMIFAGTVPTTMEGELRGGRNEYIHWIQDVPDQRAIVRQYMKYEHEIRSPHNAIQIVLRALQFCMTEPKGPTYLIASRETLEADTHPPSTKPSQKPELNMAVEPIGLSPSSIEYLAHALVSAENPLIVTSYCGRSAAGFEALKSLAELLAIPVHENAPIYNNFPTTSILHQGHQWNGGGQLPALAEADVVLVVDADVPWIGAQSRPKDEARVFHLDSDPLKDSTTLWSLPCEKRWRAESSLALTQLISFINDEALVSDSVKATIASRTSKLEARFLARQNRLQTAEVPPSDGSVTVPFVMSRLREACSDISVVGLNESTTNLGNVADHLRHEKPLSLIGSGGGALGWYSGAAVGAHMALQSQGRDDLLVAFTGDGTWLFGVPSCAYWMAKRYNTPFLTIIWNNGGWASPKNACLRIHDHLGTESNLSEKFGVSLSPSPSFGKIAEGAGGAWWAVIEKANQVDSSLREAIRMVREEKRCALLEVKIKTI